MRLSSLITLLSVTLLTCTSNGQKNNIPPMEFLRAIASDRAQLIDVRTQEEFNDRHLKGATLMNLSNGDFDKSHQTLDKAKPVYLYCLSGGRSGSALDILIAEGYNAYNLAGGIIAWESANLPVERGGGVKSGGMNMNDYLHLVKGKKVVLIDFTAVWCGPCKMIKPTLRNLEKKYEGQVTVVEIDVDKNRPLAQEMLVRSIPLLILYNNGKEVWRTMGVTEEAAFDEAIRKVL